MEWQARMEVEQHMQGQMLNQMNDMMSVIFNRNVSQGNFRSLP